MAEREKKSRGKSSLKKFTHDQIQVKLQERKDIPNYHDVLMECSVKQDAEGVYFDLHHSSWKKLVQMVREYDANQKREPKTLPNQTRNLPAFFDLSEQVLAGLNLLMRQCKAAYVLRRGASHPIFPSE